MESQIISILGQLAGVGTGIGIIIWLAVYTLKEVQGGRVRDRETSDRRIVHLESQIKELAAEVSRLTAEVKELTEELRKARTENNTKDLEIVRLRTVLIRHGWEEELNELRD